MTTQEFKEANPQLAHLEGNALWDAMEDSMIKNCQSTPTEFPKFEEWVLSDISEEEIHHKVCELIFFNGKGVYSDESYRNRAIDLLVHNNPDSVWVDYFDLCKVFSPEIFPRVPYEEPEPKTAHQMYWIPMGIEPSKKNKLIPRYMSLPKTENPTRN